MHAPTETQPSQIVIECNALFAEQLREALLNAAPDESVESGIAPVLSRDEPRQGADGGALIHWAISVDVHLAINLAQTLWAAAAVILVVNPRIVAGRHFNKVIRSLGDLAQLHKVLTGKEPAVAAAPAVKKTKKGPTKRHASKKKDAG